MADDPPVDADAIASALERAFPDLERVSPCRVLGGGFHNLAIETAGGIVFRIGRDDGGPARFKREFRVLPTLSSMLPAPIPVPRWFSDSTPEFPRGVIGYRKIQGEPVKPGERYTNGLADELARFLAALHAVPVKQARGLGLSAVAGRDGYRETWARTEPLLRERLSSGQYAGVAGWWGRFIADDSLFQYTPAVVHTDIWQENVLVDEAGHLAGVLDFDHIGIGDPAQDIAALGHLGSEFASAAREAYAKVAPWGNELERRAHTLWDFRALEEVDWAIEMGRDQAIAEAVARLSRMLAR